MIEALKRNENIKKYKIGKLTSHQFKDFLELKHQIYPSRKNIEERFQHQILSNPLLKDKSNTFILVAYSKGNKIIGQLVCNPCEYFFSNKCLSGFNIRDFYVLEDYRKKGIGTSLIVKALESYKPAFCTVNEDSIRIFLSCGFRIIGSLNKYVWFRQCSSPFQMLAYPFLSKEEKYISNPSCLKSLELPKDLISNSGNFKLVDSLDWKEEAINNNLITFVRTNEILQWRFFNNKGGYFFYLLDNCSTPSYFVVRKVLWRGLKFLEIVDYRVPIDVVGLFKLILDASKLLAKVISFDGVITMSSHMFFDKELVKSMFFRVGKPLLYLANIDINFQEKEIKDRNVLFATMLEK